MKHSLSHRFQRRVILSIHLQSFIFRSLSSLSRLWVDGWVILSLLFIYNSLRLTHCIRNTRSSACPILTQHNPPWVSIQDTTNPKTSLFSILWLLESILFPSFYYSVLFPFNLLVCTPTQRFEINQSQGSDNIVILDNLWEHVLGIKISFAGLKGVAWSENRSQRWAHLFLIALHGFLCSAAYYKRHVGICICL